MAQLGFGAIPKLAVGPFEHMMARVCQRGSRRGPRHAMVCRLRVAMAGCRPPSLRAPKDGEDGQIVAFFRWWPPSTLLDGPGETLNGSVRPRRASLRPDGVRTVPTAPGRDPRRGKGVKMPVSRWRMAVLGWPVLIQSNAVLRWPVLMQSNAVLRHCVLLRYSLVLGQMW